MRNSVIIGCDNAGVELKKVLLHTLQEQGIAAEDVGCADAKDETYYPYIAQALCRRVIDSGYQKRGILICGTGIGMSICANKFEGIRAAVCHDNYSAERLILSNDGNVICFGARVVGAELAKKILLEWLSLEFVDGSSTPKVEAIESIERESFKSHRM